MRQKLYAEQVYRHFSFDHLSNHGPSSRQKHIVLPLNTTGDGSCLLHATSRAIWGVELFSQLLRIKVAEELEENKSWYADRVGVEDWKEAVAQARKPNDYLTTVTSPRCPQAVS